MAKWFASALPRNDPNHSKIIIQTQLCESSTIGLTFISGQCFTFFFGSIEPLFHFEPMKSTGTAQRKYR